jgi:hypothetical protein
MLTLSGVHKILDIHRDAAEAAEAFAPRPDEPVASAERHG